jgi:hypothetical protein
VFVDLRHSALGNGKKKKKAFPAYLAAHGPYQEELETV